MDEAPPSAIRSHAPAAPPDPRAVEAPVRPDATGMGHALVAYGIWGIAPVYWKVTAAFPSSELLAYRVLSSFAIALLLLATTRRFSEIRASVASPRAAAAVVAAALLIATNWLTFIYAVQTDRILATSLGYYINPLVNVLFGLVLLRERLSRPQGIAVVLATLGVAWQTWALGELPWISLLLATSFGLYGLVRKLAPATPLAGYGLETLILSPFALGFLAWLVSRGDATVGGASAGFQALVWASGIITALPLVAFASAAKRLPLTTLGMFQYLAPTLSFLLAVSFYGEEFRLEHAVSFGLVWLALALYGWDLWQRAPRVPAAVAAGPPGLYPTGQEIPEEEP